MKCSENASAPASGRKIGASQKAFKDSGSVNASDRRLATHDIAEPMNKGSPGSRGTLLAIRMGSGHVRAIVRTLKRTVVRTQGCGAADAGFTDQERITSICRGRIRSAKV